MKKVLLASEYRIFLRRNTNLLMRRGFQLFTAASGGEALRLLEEHLFDLVILDFKLEDMSGCTLCALIRKEKKFQDLPVIVACHNIPGSIERVEQSGATAMLLKPIDPLQLLETVGRFLGIEIGRSKRVVLKVNVLSKEANLEFSCYSHDISTTGILLETDYQLALTSRINCRFTLPGSCRIETEAEVIRCMSAIECENLYGVKFIALPLSCRRAIDNYVISAENLGTELPTTEQDLLPDTPSVPGSST